jgi:glycosyltransferase involved in cell wall biosynthesis
MKKYLIIGDAENTHTVKWVRALVPWFEVSVISSKSTHPDIHKLIPKDRIHEFKLNVLPEGGNYHLLMKLPAIRRIIRSIRPDFVNAHYITSHGFVAALVKKFTRMKFTLIQSAWGSDILVTPFRNRGYRLLTRFILNSGDMVTSDSRFMTEVIHRLTTTRTMTFAFGLEHMPAYDPSKKEEFLFFSNRMLSANYNIGEIIRFFSRIAAIEPKAQLIISHDGDLRKPLEEYVNKMGLEKRVQFLGFIREEEQEIHYRRAQFYLSIPASDATSVSLLEAMAHGCIPIVSDIPANHEWITEAVNGLFYKEGETGMKDLVSILNQKKDVVHVNREIIQKRAIFPDLIRHYVEQINRL